MDLHVAEARAGNQRGQIVCAIEANAVSSISDHSPVFAQHYLTGANSAVFDFPLPANDHLIVDFGLRDIRAERAEKGSRDY